ncbi:PREDICTED: phosphatidylglycerophosphatase and protein-tyrosine phosphatase 1 [Gavialis gangeticus]|uniref:phosphatidylglycerophosphatase and protein-tyrosine phosphatase 1 n=1 Tax=Gavialis gangeticus TaxID=94835 RepID=UPI00092F38D0|nr:PREDICTED: phosphatidylglycerophosphatase and protein-tyrosine phosphatase 1 [Gavialis gangeticus]
MRPGLAMGLGLGLGPVLGAVVARLLFYPTLLYTLARERLPLRRRPGFHRIDGSVLLGALPLRARSPQLVQEENVRAVLTLNEDYETRFLCFSAREWEAMGVEQLRLSTVDLTGVPTLENLQKGVEFVLKHRECGNSVYVHCKAGRSRSATMVAAYLIQVHNWSPREAIEAIAKIRPHILIRHKQVQVLERFHKHVIAGTASQSEQKPSETTFQFPPKNFES